MESPDNEPQHPYEGPLYEVHDLDPNTAPEEMAALLNEPEARGSYVLTILPWVTATGPSARVVFKRRTGRVPAGPTLESKAMQFIRDNREMDLKQLGAALKAIGFQRSGPWIAAKLAEVIRADRSVR